MRTAARLPTASPEKPLMNKKSMQALFADAKCVTSSLCGLMLALAAGASMAQGQASASATSGAQPGRIQAQAQGQVSPADSGATPQAAPVAPAPVMSRERFDELEARAPIAQRYPAGSIKSDETAQKAEQQLTGGGWLGRSTHKSRLAEKQIPLCAWSK